jgi:hypothetical protein
MAGQSSKGSASCPGRRAHARNRVGR